MSTNTFLKLNSQSSHNVRERAQWERSRVITFCDICKRELENGNRSGGSLKKFVWTNIATKFKNETGLTYDSQQMKHKWDTLKKEWKNWRILKRLATGLGWNPRKGTIDATDDWWERNIKANPEIAKFRAKGIDPELEDKLGFLFDGTVAKGDDMWSPSAGCPPRRFFEASSSSQIPFEDIDIHTTPLEEFGVDLGIPDLNDDHENEGTKESYTSVEIIENPIKKRQISSSSTQKKKLCKKKFGGASMLSTKIDEIKGEFDKHRETIMSRVNKLPPTISEAVEVLMAMKDDIPPCSTLYRFATKLLLDKDKREMFMALKSYENRLWYLKVEESEAAANEAQTFTSLLGNNNSNFSL